MKNKTIFRIILATVVGELALILFTTFAQEILFDGIRYSTSSNFDIYVGGFATFIAAVLAGIITTLINRRWNYIPQTIISILIFIETSFLIFSGKTDDPIWADALAGLSLILGIWLGYLMVKRFFLKPAL